MTGHKTNRPTLALTATVSPNSITRLQMRMQLGSHLPTFLLVTYGKRGEGDSRETDIQKCVCARGIIPEPDPTGPALPCPALPDPTDGRYILTLRPHHRQRARRPRPWPWHTTHLALRKVPTKVAPSPFEPAVASAPVCLPASRCLPAGLPSPLSSSPPHHLSSQPHSLVTRSLIYDPTARHPKQNDGRGRGRAGGRSRGAALGLNMKKILDSLSLFFLLYRRR